MLVLPLYAFGTSAAATREEDAAALVAAGLEIRGR
jgi:hypothetical protein